MNFKGIINSPILKTVGKYAGVVVTGVLAITGALADQKKEKEFEELKKTVSELQKKN